MQTSVLMLAALVVILVDYLRQLWAPHQHQLNEVCGEDELGRQLYRLLLAALLVLVVLHSLLETVWAGLARVWAGHLSSPQFDTSRNTTVLLYCQVLSEHELNVTSNISFVQRIILFEPYPYEMRRY